MSKENEKVTNYSTLVKEIRKMHGVLTKIMPLVDGYSGVVSGWLFFFLRSWDSGCVGRNAGLFSHWYAHTTVMLQKTLTF